MLIVKYHHVDHKENFEVRGFHLFGDDKKDFDKRFINFVKNQLDNDEMQLGIKFDIDTKLLKTLNDVLMHCNMLIRVEVNGREIIYPHAEAFYRDFVLHSILPQIP